MKRKVEALDMGGGPLFGDAYGIEVKKQKPNYDNPPYDRWPDGQRYTAFVDSGLPYDPEDLPFHTNELTQIRTSYDPDGIEDLAGRVKTGRAVPPYIELKQAVRIAEFDNEAALREFLANHRLYHGLAEPEDIDTLDPEPNGNIRITNYGHRRQRAIKVATAEVGYTVLNRDVKKDIVLNPSFEDFIDSQSKENESRRPNPEDEAHDIRKRFNYYKAKYNGQEPTKAELSRIMGYSEGKIRDALRFTELPPSVLAWFDAKVINYAVAVECWRLQDAFTDYYSQKYPHKYDVGAGKLQTDAEAAVLAELSNFAKEHMQGASYERKMGIIVAKINSLKATGQDGLFEDGYWADPHKQKNAAGAKVARYAITVLELRLTDPDLTDAELVALQGLYERTIARRAELAARRERLTAEAIVTTVFMQEQDLFV